MTVYIALSRMVFNLFNLADLWRYRIQSEKNRVGDGHIERHALESIGLGARLRRCEESISRRVSVWVNVYIESQLHFLPFLSSV